MTIALLLEEYAIELLAREVNDARKPELTAAHEALASMDAVAGFTKSGKPGVKVAKLGRPRLIDVLSSDSEFSDDGHELRGFWLEQTMEETGVEHGDDESLTTTQNYSFNSTHV